MKYLVMLLLVASLASCSDKMQVNAPHMDQAGSYVRVTAYKQGQPNGSTRIVWVPANK